MIYMAIFVVILQYSNVGRGGVSHCIAKQMRGRGLGEPKSPKQFVNLGINSLIWSPKTLKDAFYCTTAGGGPRDAKFVLHEYASSAVKAPLNVDSLYPPLSPPSKPEEIWRCKFVNWLPNIFVTQILFFG
jgi:hypothetical protein